VRFSIGAFNTEDHIRTAIKAVETIADWNVRRKQTKAAKAGQ
jgi:cysteine sulfinate desulfinase/cysteine desulfurase-like protein